MRALTLAFLVACADPVPVPAVVPVDDPTGAYITLIRRVARPDGVDWATLRARRDVLERYVSWLSEHGPLTDDMRESHESERLAFLLNAHSALVLYGLLYRGLPERLDQPFGFGDFFKDQRFRLDEEWITLSLLESERLLGRFQEPTVHAGLYRATRGGPSLRAWRSVSIWSSLAEETEAWLASDRGLRKVGDAYSISDYFLQYADDFTYWGPADTLCDWLVDHTKDDAQTWMKAHQRDCPLTGFEYDWTLDRGAEVTEEDPAEEVAPTETSPAPPTPP